MTAQSEQILENNLIAQLSDEVMLLDYMTMQHTAYACNNLLGLL